MPQNQIKSSINQYVALTLNLSDEFYCFSKLGISSAGAHVRHVIDRMNCFLEGMKSGQINYDLRARNPKIETDRHLAISNLQKINNFFSSFKKEDSFHKITIIETLNPNHKATKIESNINREIADLIIHNTHHLAIIKVILQDHFDFDQNFGKAPSTIIYEKESIN
jgi:hypothetical protein